MDGAELERPVSLPAVVVRKLPEWRREYGPDLIYVPKWEIILRPLNRGEVVDFHRNSVTDLLWAQISLFRSCLLHPAEWAVFADSISLGDFQSAFNALYRLSGFQNPQTFDKDLHQWRIHVLERDHAVIRHICRAFPTITDKDVNAMPRTRILYLLAQAECMLGVTYDGQDLAKMQETWAAEAQREQIRSRAEMIRAGLAPKTRSFNVEEDLRAQHGVDRDFSDVDMTVNQFREHRKRNGR